MTLKKSNIVTIICIVFVVQSFAQYVDNTCEKRSKADIFFVLDASSSIGPTNWVYLTNFAAQVTQAFTVGPNDIQFACMIFSDQPTSIFSLNAYLDKDYIYQNIRAIKYPYSQGTYTHRALRKITQEKLFSSTAGGRDDANKIVIVITDGMSVDTNKTLSEAQLLKDQGVIIISVGISKAVKLSELQGMATDSDKVMTVDSFKKLSVIKNDLVKTTCNAENICRKTDIYLVLDASSSIGRTNWTYLTNLAAEVTQAFTVGPKDIQFACLIFNIQPNKIFGLNTYLDKRLINNNIKKMKYPYRLGTYTHRALRMIRQEKLFTSAKGGRNDANKIVIVMTDGISIDKSRTLHEAQLLKDQGVIITSVGIGKEMNLSELKGMATDTKKVIIVESSKDRGIIKNDLVKKTCY